MHLVSVRGKSLKNPPPALKERISVFKKKGKTRGLFRIVQKG